MSTPSPSTAGGRPILDPTLRLHAGQVLLGFAAVLAVTALARPLAADRPVWLRASILLLLAAGAAAAAILTSLRGRGTTEPLALYSFLVLAADAVGQWLSPHGWPVWPATVLLVAGVSIAEPMATALGIAALAAVLETAEAARGGFAAWKPALMAVLGYGGLVLAVNRALAAEKRRLSTTLAELARLRHGIGHLEDTVSVPIGGTHDLRHVSEEERRTRQMERAEDLDASLTRLVRVARQALSAHAVLLFSIDREQEHACLRAADAPLPLRQDPFLPVRQDPFGFVIDRGETFYLTDFPRLLSSLPYYASEVKVGTLLAVPVKEAGAVRGVLIADRLETQKMTGAEASMLEAFAEMVTETFVRSREMASRDERRTELEVVSHASEELADMKEVLPLCRRLLELVGQCLRLEGAAVVRIDEQQTRYTVEAAAGWAGPYEGREVAIDEKTWVAWAVRGTDPIRLDDVGRHDPIPVLVLDEDGRAGDALLVLPLRAQARALGAVVMTAAPGALRASSTHVVEILVNQAAAVMSTIQLAEREREKALLDPLTGLLNRRAFFDSLSQSVARRERQGGQLCLLMLDLDHFKKLNDTHGHPAGDAAIKATAAALRRVLRKGDVPARYGGEEFVVMLPGASESVAQQIAERLRATLEKARIEFGGTTLQVTASIGLGVWPENGRAPDELLAAADRALYSAKAAGRNRVVCAPRPVARELNT